MEDIGSGKKKFEVYVYAKKLLDKLENLNTKIKNPIDIEEVKKGIYYARKYHGSQMRQSGDPYYSNPIEVTIMLAEFVAEEVPKLFMTISYFMILLRI
ncbi:guanosine polyphosphate pyrophosphohydrolase/synthetase-like protein [Rickettsia montanensis str. OSU 85-930]|uniref:Guanosine polyphosphate pyrophosphohydrolase/synthetase-like protein n=1 Tax=Rickettsia montanensis (strain OSU 85-930) TaxID=1105114 RepID=H8KC12_RICMS|nr:guanosine polyphosphate pyrophosphohydrolase/synthetase-like protein [Rickettsia montanensis str. OSU 85-930]